MKMTSSNPITCPMSSWVRLSFGLDGSVLMVVQVMDRIQNVQQLMKPLTVFSSTTESASRYVLFCILPKCCSGWTYLGSS